MYYLFRIVNKDYVYLSSYFPKVLLLLMDVEVGGPVFPTGKMHFLRSETIAMVSCAECGMQAEAFIVNKLRFLFRKLNLLDIKSLGLMRWKGRRRLSCLKCPAEHW